MIGPRRSTDPQPPRGRALSGLATDLRSALRLLRKNPAVIGATVGGLALAIAVCTSVFTILYAAVLRPYGMDDPATISRIQMIVRFGSSTAWPYEAFRELQDRARLARIEASVRETVRVARQPADSDEQKTEMLIVSAGYLPMLGGRAALGRSLQPQDDAPGAAPVVVVNHAFWSARLNADPNAIGQPLWLFGHPFTVVGVIEPSFTGPVDTPPSLWLPFGSYGALYGDRPLDRTSRLLVRLIARSAPGVSRSVAEQELSTLAAALPDDVGIRLESGAIDPVTGVRLDAAGSRFDGPDAVEMMLVIGLILFVVALVLALACANVANLLLAGAASRGREIGIRLAIGASRGRILRQLLTESLLIGLIAGGGGLALSLVAVTAIASAVGLSESYDVRPDGVVLVFTVVVSVLSGIGAGLAPAYYSARGDLTAALRTETAGGGTRRQTSRLRRGFIGLQAAASIVLLVTAALFTRAAWHLTTIDIGFDAKALVAIAPGFPQSFTAGDVSRYWPLALDRVRAIPAVEDAALVLHTPFGGSITVTNLDRNGVTYQIFENRTDAAYFQTAGLRIVRGRPYSAAEVAATAPVAVISEGVVRDVLGGRDPIGTSLGDVTRHLAGVTVVGVVEDAVTARVRGAGHGAIYRPIDSASLSLAQLVVRAPHPEAVVRNLQSALVAADPRVRPSLTVVSDDVDRYLNEPIVLAGLSGSMGALALVLAVLGLYGVTAFVVGQRVRELSIRLAIGASTAAIARLVIRQSLTPVVIGLIAGLAVALAIARLITPALSGLSPYDPVAIGGATLLLLGAALLAAAFPALRAARTDPIQSLRL
jgi:predicted permease